jgi:CrcB protein
VEGSTAVKWGLLFLGGGIGTALRFALSASIEARTGPGFPWGTFAVNVSGCLAIGVIVTLADEHAWITPTARAMLVPGLLGGFTTFSTFGMETWQLVEDGEVWLALANVLASLALGLTAVVVGVRVTSQLI